MIACAFTSRPESRGGGVLARRAQSQAACIDTLRCMVAPTYSEMYPFLRIPVGLPWMGNDTLCGQDWTLDSDSETIGFLVDQSLAALRGQG